MVLLLAKRRVGVEDCRPDSSSGGRNQIVSRAAERYFSSAAGKVIAAIRNPAPS